MATHRVQVSASGTGTSSVSAPVDSGIGRIDAEHPAEVGDAVLLPAAELDRHDRRVSAPHQVVVRPPGGSERGGDDVDVADEVARVEDGEHPGHRVTGA